MWIAVIALAGTVVTGAFTYKTSRATTRVEESKVDAAAYDRAKQIYESALKLLEEQLEKVRAQLDTVTTQLAQEQDASAAMKLKIRALEEQVATFERTVSDLRLQLARSGIPATSEEM